MPSRKSGRPNAVLIEDASGNRSGLISAKPEAFDHCTNRVCELTFEPEQALPVILLAIDSGWPTLQDEVPSRLEQRPPTPDIIVPMEPRPIMY